MKLSDNILKGVNTMTFAEIKELNAMGFSHDEIMAIITGSSIAQTSPAPVPAAPAADEQKPAEEQAPVPVPVPVPAEEQAPVPAPAAPAPGQDLNLVLSQLSGLNTNISQLVQTVQASNIINSRNTVPKTETVDDVMAQILNPADNKPLGGN